MRSIKLTAALAAALVLGTTPALAAAAAPASHAGGHGHAGQATTVAAPAPHGKALGHQCRDQSKKHVAGAKGTPFSQCVSGLAKAQHGSSPTTDS